MKFSQRRKDKMKKARFNRAKKFYGNQTGYCVDGAKEVVDTLEFDNTLYLLTQDGLQYCILKTVSDKRRVQLSNKKVLKLKAIFERNSKWKNHTKVSINDLGTIETIEMAPKPWEKWKGSVHIFVEI